MDTSSQPGGQGELVPCGYLPRQGVEAEGAVTDSERERDGNSLGQVGIYHFKGLIEPAAKTPV